MGKGVTSSGLLKVMDAIIRDLVGRFSLLERGGEGIVEGRSGSWENSCRFIRNLESVWKEEDWAEKFTSKVVCLMKTFPSLRDFFFFGRKSRDG